MGASPTLPPPVAVCGPHWGSAPGPYRLMTMVIGPPPLWQILIRRCQARRITLNQVKLC